MEYMLQDDMELSGIQSPVDIGIVNKANRLVKRKITCRNSMHIFMRGHFQWHFFIFLRVLDWRSMQFLLAVLQLQTAGPFSKGDKAGSLIGLFTVTSHVLDIGNYGL